MPRIRSGNDILEERAREAGIVLEDPIPGQVFFDLGLNIIVRCTGCQMTMALPSCYVDDEGHTWCRDCAGIVEEQE